ncbi:MAG: two-component sensor histidine kinase [Acidimicrobiaceae bacterium]|nr:two-component sensor histidine kinase [Acidimicrobiaceae bacterium]
MRLLQVSAVSHLAGIDRSWPSVRTAVVDGAIAAAVCAGALIFEGLDAGDVGASLDAVDFATCAVAAALILLRRRAPLPVLVVAVFAAVWSMIPDDVQGVLPAAAIVALYTVASTSDRTTAWTAGAATAAALYLTAAITSAGPWYDSDNLELIAWTAVATAAGDAVRSRRAYKIARQERATALEERAERAERALEEEARRQVVEERMRIARELHDVVAHHIAVINVQAGVATHLLRDNPTGAEEALTHVRHGAANVLDELSNILSVIRRSDEVTSTTDPLPALDDLQRLVADFTNVGLEIDWHTVGAPRPVTPATGLAAYRIIQESLTNAHRHGCHRRAILRLTYEPDALHIEILNDVDADQPVGTPRGHGTVGMRERVVAAGGAIEVGPTGDSQFRVHATLPTEQAEP